MATDYFLNFLRLLQSFKKHVTMSSRTVLVTDNELQQVFVCGYVYQTLERKNMNVGDLIGGRYRVTKPCSNSGGMGAIVHVTDVQSPQLPLVLKYCKHVDPKLLARFRREIGILFHFKGNNRVVQIHGWDMDHIPPYFVMRFYPDGDLTELRNEFQCDPEFQEKMFYEIIDSVDVLHSVNVFHRDIKPQNFLLNGNSVVVADMGLGIEIDSASTTLTSSESMGTQAYMPPENILDFKNSSAAGDIYMLGKTFFNLITGQPPFVLVLDDIHPALRYVIETACNQDKSKRFQTLSELKQAIFQAYSIILNRFDSTSKARVLLEEIMAKIHNERKFDITKVGEFLNLLYSLEDYEAESIIQSLDKEFFAVISQSYFDVQRNSLLSKYKIMVENTNYSWSFAEKIAECMRVIWLSQNVTSKEKCAALEMAISAASSQNRFAAMRVCESMIMQISNNEVELASYMVPILASYSETFIRDIEPNQCQNIAIANAIKRMQTGT